MVSGKLSSELHKVLVSSHGAFSHAYKVPIEITPMPLVQKKHPLYPCKKVLL